MKYENDFNKDNKLLCNKGKILKEPIINFLKNKITLTLKINIEDIDKKIYFLQRPVGYFEKEEYKININNFVIFINDKIYENKNYFVTKTVGIYHIKIFIKNNIHN